MGVLLIFTRACHPRRKAALSNTKGNSCYERTVYLRCQGRHTAIVIPIEEWNNITAKHQDLKLLENARQKPSDFRGAITKKTADELLRHTEKERKEWGSNLS